MTALQTFARIDATDGISFVETDANEWTVTIDGTDEYTITRDTQGWVAWIGCQDRHWAFARALKACAEHARFNRDAADRAEKANGATRAALAAMSVEDRATAVASLEAARDRLTYAPSGVDIAAKSAVIDQQIAAIRSAVA